MRLRFCTEKLDVFLKLMNTIMEIFVTRIFKNFYVNEKLSVQELNLHIKPLFNLEN